MIRAAYIDEFSTLLWKSKVSIIFVWNGSFIFRTFSVMQMCPNSDMHGNSIVDLQVNYVGRSSILKDSWRLNTQRRCINLSSFLLHYFPIFVLNE